MRFWARHWFIAAQAIEKNVPRPTPGSPLFIAAQAIEKFVRFGAGGGKEFIAAQAIEKRRKGWA